MVIINLAMKPTAAPLGIFIQPSQVQMLQTPLSNLTDDQDGRRSSGSETASDGTTAIDSWSDGFSMLILSLSFFCSKLTSWMNPASIIIIILLTLNLVKGLDDGHLLGELRDLFTMLWDRHRSLGRQERVVETQAHRSTNEEVKTEAPYKKGKDSESETRLSSIDKKTVRQAVKQLAEDRVNCPPDPAQEGRERTKEPIEIDNNGQISSTNKAVDASQKEKPKHFENPSASEQIRVLTESEKTQKSKITNDQVKSQSNK